MKAMQRAFQSDRKGENQCAACRQVGLEPKLPMAVGYLVEPLGYEHVSFVKPEGLSIII